MRIYLPKTQSICLAFAGVGTPTCHIGEGIPGVLVDVPVRRSQEGHGDARHAEDGCLGSINHGSATSSGVGWRGLVVVGKGWVAIAGRLGGRNGDASSGGSRVTAQAKASLVASGDRSSGSLGHRTTGGEGDGAVGGLDDGAIVHRIDVESYLVSIDSGEQRGCIVAYHRPSWSRVPGERPSQCGFYQLVGEVGVSRSSWSGRVLMQEAGRSSQ